MKNSRCVLFFPPKDGGVRFTDEQKRAARLIQRGINAARKAGLKATVMDDGLTLLCGKSEDHESCEGDFGPLANAIQSQMFEQAAINTFEFLGDSGGF